MFALEKSFKFPIRQKRALILRIKINALIIFIFYSTVTDLAKFLGLSISNPFSLAVK